MEAPAQDSSSEGLVRELLQLTDSDEPPRVELQENGRPISLWFASEDDAHGAHRALGEWFDRAIGLKLVAVSTHYRPQRHSTSEERFEVRVSPGTCCGYAPVHLPATSTQGHDMSTVVRVKPKLSDARWLDLISLAEGWNEVPTQMDVDLDAGEDCPLVSIALAFLRSLAQLLGMDAEGAPYVGSTGLRRLHVNHREVLRGRIRGRPELPSYLRYLASGRPLHIPCRYAAHRIDNPYNQALRWALHLVRGIASRLGSKASKLKRLLLSGQENRGLPGYQQLDDAFFGVSLEPWTPGRLRLLDRFPGTFQSYETSGALPLARWLIQNAGLGDDPGDHRSISFSYTAYSIFERAFARVVRRHSWPFEYIAGEQFEQPDWRFSIGDRVSGQTGVVSKKTFSPDIYLPGNDELLPLIADTKWKFAFRPEVATAEPVTDDAAEDDDDGDGLLDVRFNLKLRNEDIFQVTSYAYLASLRKAAAEGNGSPGAVVSALVYPTDRTDLSEDVVKPRKLNWLPDEGDDEPDIRVHVAPWRVGGPDVEGDARRVLDELRGLRRVP